jgi:hypothetical protein
MSHSCKQDKNPSLSLTHHCLAQLLIQKGFSQQNPPLNNPPIDPQEAVEHHENLQEQQPQNLPDPPEIPNNLPTDPNDPINPPTIPSPSHNLPESSTPTVHILSDDSEPANSPYPIIEEKPTRKRKKQIPSFPSFLQRKRKRTSTRAATTATALNPQPILLKARTPLPFQIPEFLPIPPMGTETQEAEAQCTVTSFSLNQVVETQEPTTHLVALTQEPTTHPVAETQEPATHPIVETQEPKTHSVAETQEPAIAVTQEPATVETQEPVADVVTKIQESDAQGATTLLSLHKEAETQESTTDLVASPQEPTIAAVTITQELVTSLNTPMKYQQPEPTMAFVLQENEFLRSELEAYKQELVMVKDAYDKELKLYTLARIATMTEESTKENQCREYMCSQCGDIYYQVGYKVTQIPMPGASPAPTTFAVKEENTAITQEPIRPSKIQNEP